MRDVSTATRQISAVTNRLLASRRLPEQHYFRAGGQLHRAYRARDPATYEWHLPDLVRARVTTPIRRRRHLPFRMTLPPSASPRTPVRRADPRPGETPRHAHRGFALSGSDWRVRLYIQCSDDLQLCPTCSTSTPISRRDRACRCPSRPRYMASLRAAGRGRSTSAADPARSSGPMAIISDCRTVRLPDGATWMTFKDVTVFEFETRPKEYNTSLEQRRTDQDRFRSTTVLASCTSRLPTSSDLLISRRPRPVHLTAKQAGIARHIAGSIMHGLPLSITSSISPRSAPERSRSLSTAVDNPHRHGGRRLRACRTACSDASNWSFSAPATSQLRGRLTARPTDPVQPLFRTPSGFSPPGGRWCSLPSVRGIRSRHVQDQLSRHSERKIKERCRLVRVPHPTASAIAAPALTVDRALVR